MMDGTEKNIEDIQRGDKVVSYRMGESRHFSSTSDNSAQPRKLKGYEVLETASHIENKIITVTTESGKSSSYAPNHIKYARFKNEKDRWITYIMGNEKGQYRVGKTILFTNGKHIYSGIRNRMHQEKCTHAWILGSFDSKQEAWFTEQIAAVQFGIPQITFQLAKVDYTETFVDKLFLSIPNMKERLSNVLSHFGREFDYPIATTSEWRGTQPRHLSKTSLFPVEACNVMPECMEVLEYDKSNSKGNYSTIIDVSSVQEETMVYGLSIEKYHNYVADGILTHNCVYSFRGSNIDNMMNIRKFDKDVQTILLEQNYRSSNNIVKASNGFIANNKKQLEKISYTDNDDGAPIFIYDSVDETKESDFVVAMIEGLVKTKGASYDDFAVLYRSNYQSRNIEFAFSRVGIPYGVVGGSEFYERDEVKTLVSYLRALDNEMDDLAYSRILNKPKRGLGDASLNRIKMYASTGNIPFSKAMEHIADIDKINKPSKAKILDIVSMIQKGREIARRPNASVVELLRYIILETKFMDQYDTDRSAHVECIQNIQELWNVANSFDTREHEDLEEGQTILTQFLTETALYVKPTDKEEQAVVSLTTAHSAKGLEYKYVFVIGVQAGTFPSRLSQSDADYEEERRLFYVSMTRAKDILFLSFNRKRYVRGQTVDSGPSRFIGEIPSQYVRYLGVKKQEE